MAKKIEKDGVPRELERAGSLCLAFANTAMPERDGRRKVPRTEPALSLESYDELVGWGQRLGALPASEGDRLRQLAAERPQAVSEVLTAAETLRSAILRAFTALALDDEPRAEALDTVNAALRRRKIVRAADGFRWRAAAAPEALDGVLAAVAQSAADLLVSDQLGKVRQCGAKDCSRLFVYRSSRRLWCDMYRCGNRLKSQRYQKRWKR